MADAQGLALGSRSDLDVPVGTHETSADRLSQQTVGQDLRRARQCKGITPEVIWRDLKIAPHHLSAIEDGCFDTLPGRVYVVGFVRSYARYLGLDVETCLARLKTELPGPNPSTVFRPLPQPEPAARFGAAPVEIANASDSDIGPFLPRERLEINPERGMQHYVVIGLIIAVLVYGGYNVFSSSRLTARSAIVPVPARLATEAGLIPKKKAPAASAEIASPERASVQSLASIEAAPVFAAEANHATSIESNAAPGSRTGIELAPLLPPKPNRARSTDATSVVSAPQTAIEPLPDLTPKPTGAGSSEAKVTSVRPNKVETASVLPSKSNPIQSPEAAATNVMRARPNTKVESAPAFPPQSAQVASTEDISPKEPLFASSEHTSRFRPPLPLGARYGLENGNSRVVLRLHRSIRVSVKGSRNRVFLDRLLGAGATYRVPNTPGVKLTVRDAGAVEVILDGNTVGFAGKDGVAAKALGLDPPSIIRRYHWQ